MKETKKRYQSKTIVAVTILVLAFLKEQFDITVTENEVETLFMMWTEMVAFLVAIYWRIVADKEIV